jgi:hypothetical protein
VNEEQKRLYKEKYTQAKAKGEKFYPDVIYQDVLITFGIFLLLVGLAIFIGVAVEPKADPSDSAYIPRPEWYFMFLFEMLKYFPGKLEWVGTFIIPTIAILALFLLPALLQAENCYCHHDGHCNWYSNPDNHGSGKYTTPGGNWDDCHDPTRKNHSRTRPLFYQLRGMPWSRGRGW